MDAPLGAADDREVGLVVEQFVDLIADQSARPGRVIIARHVLAAGAGDADGRIGRRADRLQAAGEAEDTLRRARLAILVDALPAREVADRHGIAERVTEGRGEAVDLGLLFVQIDDAEIGAVVDARQRAVVHAAQEIGDAIDRRVVVILVNIGERQAGVAVDADGDRRRHAPALIGFDVAAGHVIFMIHGVEAHRDQVAEPPVAVDRRPIIIVGADGGLHRRRIAREGDLADEIDRPAHASRPVEDGVGAVVDFDLLEVERVGAAVLRAVAHAVDGDVVAGRIAAQVNRIAIAAAAFARAEGDARNRRKRVAQRQQILLPDLFLRHHGHGLRRVDDRRGRFGCFHRDAVGAGDDDILPIAGRILRIVGGRGERGRADEAADAGESEERNRLHGVTPLWLLSGVRY